jgi:hypothetical protein
MQNGKELWISRIYFPTENPVDRGDVARVHRGPRLRGQEGAAAPCRRAARRR